MSLNVDLFWSFRSPYSYLALAQIIKVVERYDLTVDIRPVYPLAVRDPGFFNNPLFPTYILRDAARVAEYENIPYHWPRPDPIEQNMETREIAPEQPRIVRLMRLSAAAREAGKGFDFVAETATMMWDGKVKGWDQGDHLARATERAGLSLTDLDAAIERDPQRYDAIIEDNQDAHAASGHWGVPTFAFEGEPFFGQDRIPMLLWRLKQHGLREKA